MKCKNVKNLSVYVYEKSCVFAQNVSKYIQTSVATVEFYLKLKILLECV